MRPIFCLLLHLLILTTSAQMPQALVLTNFDESKSMIAGNVHCMLQSRTGYLWFGTSNGLVRFDSYDFVSYPNNAGAPVNITHLSEDNLNKIWVSFASGELAMFDPQTAKFTNYVLHNPNDSTIGTSEITTIFFDHANQLWLGMAQRGLVKPDLKHNTSTIYPLRDVHHAFYAPSIQKIYNSVYYIQEDEDHRLWLATHDGLYRFKDGDKLPQPVRPAPVEKNAPRKDLFHDIIMDGDSMWLGSWAGGLSCYNRKTNKWYNYLTDEKNFAKTISNLVISIGIKNKNELWQCSPDKGLGIFNKTTKSFSFFSNNPQYANIPADEWSKLMVDKDGNVWALQQQGLLRIQVPDDKFCYVPVAVSHTDNKSNYGINDVWEDESLQLIATSFADGLHVLDKKNHQRYTLKIDVNKKEEPFMSLRDIFVDSKKRIWLITRDFIYRYDRASHSLVKAMQPPLYTADSLSNSFVMMKEDSNGNLWVISRRNGCYKYQEDSITHISNFAGSAIYIPYNNINAIEKDGKDRMWIGSAEGMLGYIDPSSNKFTNLGIWLGNDQKKPGNKCYALYADEKGNVWAGTQTGLYYFDCSLASPQLVKEFYSKDGLRSDVVLNVQGDKNGNIWCLTDASICLLPKGGLPVSAYSISDGVKKGYGSTIVRTTSDTMLLMNFGGFYKFLPAQFFAAPKKYPLYITSMKVNDQVFYYEGELQENKRISLKPRQNYFSFEFAAINFSHPEKQQYAYMLEGMDKDWVQAGNRRYAGYTNVPGGKYIFRVKALGPDGRSASEQVSIPVFVGTPFIRTWWFYGLLLVVIAGIFYAVYRNRLRHHRQILQLESKAQLLEKEKALVMYDGLKQQLNPHFLFNSLTSLNSLITTDAKSAKQFLEQMSAIYRYILKSRDSELVVLSSELKFVDTYIRLQQTRFRTGLQVHVNTNEDYNSCKIVPVTLQNLVENAIKHNVIDKESPLVIDMFTENDYLVVRNNLQKKKSVETSNRQGLRSLQTLYGYLTDKPMVIAEDEQYFTVKVPLI